MEVSILVRPFFFFSMVVKRRRSFLGQYMKPKTHKKELQQRNRLGTSRIIIFCISSWFCPFLVSVSFCGVTLYGAMGGLW